MVQDHRQTVWKIQMYPDKNLHACRKCLCLKMPVSMSRKTWYLQPVPGADWQSSQLVRENSHHTGQWMWTRFLALLTGPQRGSPLPLRPRVIFSGDNNLPNLSLRKTRASLPVWWNKMPFTSILPWHLFHLNLRGFKALICAKCLFSFFSFLFLLFLSQHVSLRLYL